MDCPPGVYILSGIEIINKHTYLHVILGDKYYDGALSRRRQKVIGAPLGSMDRKELSGDIILEERPK